MVWRETRKLALDRDSWKCSECSQAIKGRNAHISGKTGMKKFVQSKGKYNPQDALGTSAQAYYDKFSGAV